MAVVLKFVRGATEVSLQAGASTGLQLADGWKPNVQISAPGAPPAPVTESLPVLATGSSHDNLATTIQGLHAMQVWTGGYLNDRMESTPVWLQAQMAGETNGRRALVYGMELSYETGWYEAESASYMQELMIVVTRGPWESTTALTNNGVLAESPGAVLTMDYTAAPGADVTGDIPARVSKFEIASQAATVAADQYDRFWIGLRSAGRHGTLTNFAPLWECEDTDGTLGTDATRAADATASPTGGGNTKVTVDAATVETWANRLTLELKDFTTNYADNFGRFLALLRAAVTAGLWEVQLKFAYSSGTVIGEGPIVEIDSTTWDWYEMGQHSIPVRDLHALATDLIAAATEQFYQVQFWARRTSGAGSLDLDCLVNLPIDEGYAVVKGADLDYAGLGAPDSALLDIGCSPEDTFQAVGLIPGAADTISIVPELSCANFYLPVGDGRAYILWAGPDVSEITDAISATVSWWPRWLSLRGAE